MKTFLVSACLAGIPCRYDGTAKFHPQVYRLLKKGGVLALCPEVLAGLPTPRTPCQIKNGDGKAVFLGKAKIEGEDGRDYTAIFIKGAKKALKIAQKFQIKEAYLKAKSPSCGCGQIYQGLKLVKGDGVFAYLLKKQKIKIYSL